MKELYSLQDIFNQRLFRIPDYQRGYSWTEQQLNEFWEDVINLPIGREHYTGMISLRKINKDEAKNWTEELWLINNWGYSAYHVVDGQQRLTTFIILINEIVKFYKSLPENEGKGYENIFINSLPLSEIIKSYLCIVKPDSEGQLKTFKFGYEVDNPSYEFFKYKILEADIPGDIQETFYTLNLEKAKEFFANILEETYKEYGLQEIEKLFVKLTQKLMFNIYNINDDFNVFIAFETMNNRGKRLSNLELLKNRLIYLTTLFNNEEDVRVSTRNKINDTWKTVYGCLGKNKQKALSDDEFLQAHWIIYFGYSRAKKDNYSDFLLKQYFTQKRILDKVNFNEQLDDINAEINEEAFIDEPVEETVSYVDKSIKDKLTIGDVGNYIDSMKNLIPYWYDMTFPTQSSFSKEIKVWLDRINRLGFVYFKPLTTVVLSKKDITDSEKVEYLKAVERFIFMHFRLSGYFSTYKNSFYYNLANSLYKGEKDINYVIKELNNIDYLNKDNVLNINAVLNNIIRLFKNYKGYYSWSTIRYFLYEYETYLMDNQANQKIYPEDIFKKDEKDKVSIEHVYPQTPTVEYWINRFKDYTDEQKNYLTGSLGNLLPLSLSINIQLQNDSFDNKKNERYYKGSHCEIEVSHFEEWTPESILKRGKKMLEFMAERWNFKFNNEYDKVKLLGLDFMEDQPDDYNDELQRYYDDELENGNEDDSLSKRAITREMVEKVYELSKQVYEGKITEQEAIDKVSELGMNASSAVMYIYCFDRMIRGEVYKRGTSTFAAEYYISKIREDYGREYSKKAIESLEKHIQYMKSKNFNNKSLESVLEAQKEFDSLY
ncbi:MAG TPA: DUF262 domain-containing protein [Gallicola sp.]|nr:DUF262 domain-containing protein [Gallicola sp.]